jgi:hypothetical protein
MPMPSVERFLKHAILQGKMNWKKNLPLRGPPQFGAICAAKKNINKPAR